MLRIAEAPRTSFWKNFNDTRPIIVVTSPAESSAAKSASDKTADEVKTSTHTHTETTHKSSSSFWESFKHESKSLLNSVRPFVDKLLDVAAWIGTGATLLAYPFAPTVAFSQIALWTVTIWGANRLFRSDSSAASAAHH